MNNDKNLAITIPHSQIEFGNKQICWFSFYLVPNFQLNAIKLSLGEHTG